MSQIDPQGLAAVSRDITIRGDIVTKRATVGRQKLLREIDWIQWLSKCAPESVPRILAVRIGANWAEYDMEYCPWPNFADMFIAGQLTGEYASEQTARILRFVSDHVHRRSICPALPAFFERNYLGKLKERLTANRGKSQRFDRLVEMPALLMGDRRILSARELCAAIAADSSLLHLLQPAVVGPFHGDLKFDNILYDAGSGRFLLIDPRGSTATGEMHSDWLEDVAKLRTCTLAYYDFHRAGRMVVHLTDNRVELRAPNDLSPLRACLAAIDSKILGVTEEIAFARGDAWWSLRLAFITPFLLLANAPFQLAQATDRDEMVAMGLYVEGVSLLDAVYRRWCALPACRSGLEILDPLNTLPGAQASHSVSVDWH